VGHYPHLEVPELVAHEIAKQPPASRV
jgi:hypothetical protein